MRLPYFKDMTDEALRIEYQGYRNLAYNNAQIAQSGNRSRAASQMGTLMKAIAIIEGIAKARKISLVTACMSCQGLVAPGKVCWKCGAKG